MVSAPASLMLADVRIMDAPGRFDVVATDGVVTDIRPTGSGDAAVGADSEVVDAGGRLCIGAFVDAHCHLDKSFLSEEPGFETAVAGDFFDLLRARKSTASAADAKARMERALGQAVLNGTGTMRAQIDVDEVVGLTHFEMAMELRAEWADRIRLQLVVFPQEGLAGNAAANEVVTEALATGADVMGGGHGFDPGVTNAQHIEACFEAAAMHDLDLDLHIDFEATPDTPWPEWDLFHVARMTKDSGLAGRVTVAHLTQHGEMAETRRSEMMAMLSESGVNLVVVPGAELNAARAWEDVPFTSPAPATADWPALIEGGVRLSYAGGHLADAFHPHGEGDLLRDGLLMCAARNLGDPVINGTHVLEMGTRNPAKIVGLGDAYGPVVGAPADLVILDAAGPDQAVRRQADRWLVVHAGKPVARTTTQRTLL